VLNLEKVWDSSEDRTDSVGIQKDLGLKKLHYTKYKSITAIVLCTSTTSYSASIEIEMWYVLYSIKNGG
jgi:hypothetical protein